MNGGDNAIASEQFFLQLAFLTMNSRYETAELLSFHTSGTSSSSQSQPPTFSTIIRSKSSKFAYLFMRIGWWWWTKLMHCFANNLFAKVMKFSLLIFFTPRNEHMDYGTHASVLEIYPLQYKWPNGQYCLLCGRFWVFFLLNFIKHFVLTHSIRKRSSIN